MTTDREKLIEEIKSLKHQLKHLDLRPMDRADKTERLRRLVRQVNGDNAHNFQKE